jgi:hypothetical protein
MQQFRQTPILHAYGVAWLLVAACGNDLGSASSFGPADTYPSSGTVGDETTDGQSTDADGTGGGDGSGPCLDASDCDDGIACTVDTCDRANGCRHQPHDAQCDNGNACDGAETCDPGLGCQPGTAVVCDDADACTMDACNPATGACAAQPLATCLSGDGCCPAGCTADMDDDCECVNIAPMATPTQSDGGGTGPYGPAAWIDGVEEHHCTPTCDACYGWVDNPEGSQLLTEYMQLDWDTKQTIGSMYIATSDAVLTPCAEPGYPRNIEQGDVQIWDGLEWVTITSFDDEQDDVWLEFVPPLETIAVRIDGIRATPSLNPQIAPPGSSVVFEWYVYEPAGCFPTLPPD